MKDIRRHFKIVCAFLAFAFGFNQSASAQITVQDNQTANTLAQTLVGAGVIMLNPVLTNCHGSANGIYSGDAGIMGIDSGIVLTSGSALQVAAPNNGGGGPSMSNGQPGDPDLNTVLAGITSNDACILEFDFIPSGDTVKFDYVFGSSEYQSFSCSSFNDVFGFFISGPGYVTPYNMAVIPGTTIPICVNSTTGVGSGGQCNQWPGSPFSQYYVDNTNGPVIAYSGFTTIFTAKAAVTPCDTYHLKLAIGDGTDQILDSGVFIKAGSLNSIGLAIGGETGGGQPNTESHAVRGCIPGKFKFSILDPQPADLTITYEYSGTASANDYEQEGNVTGTNTIVIPAGETEAELIIHALHNGQVNADPESLIIAVYSPYLCGNGEPNVVATDTLMIYDSLYVTEANIPEGICPGDSVLLSIDIAPGLYVKWSPAPLCSDPESTTTWVYPNAPTNFVASVNQTGATNTCPDVIRNFFVHVDPIPEIVMPSDHITICLSDSVDIPVDVLPDSLEYTFLWEPATYLRAANIGYNRFFAPIGTYNYVINAYSPLGCQSSEDLTIEVLPPFDLEVSPDTTIQYGDQIQLRALGALLYQWSPPRWILYPNEATPWVTPLETITYTVVGINEYGCRDTADVKVTVEYEPEDMIPTAFSPNGDGLNDRFRVEHLGEEKILQFEVFNRYGEGVYKDPGTNVGWDGTFKGADAAVDVYNYIIILSSPRGFVRTIKGDITLVR